MSPDDHVVATGTAYTVGDFAPSALKPDRGGRRSATEGKRDMTLQQLQETIYNERVDYRVGSPHLAHWHLYDRLVDVLREHVRDLKVRGLPLDVLEVGAGHGGYTEPALAAGCAVTAVEMSRPSLSRLEERFGTNPRFEPVFDEDGSLEGTADRYSLVLCVSVLHHIPDYVSFLDRATDKLAPGGTLLTLQDPLWYGRAGRRVRMLDRAGFYSWRITQGSIGQGLATTLRRVRGVWDESNPSDMVEYHALRGGVDEQAVAAGLRTSFENISILRYWSNQSAVVQRLGHRVGMENTFGISAVGRARGRTARVDSRRV
jgi:SAM-dependent methyltransferase